VYQSKGLRLELWFKVKVTFRVKIRVRLGFVVGAAWYHGPPVEPPMRSVIGLRCRYHKAHDSASGIYKRERSSILTPHIPAEVTFIRILKSYNRTFVDNSNKQTNNTKTSTHNCHGDNNTQI